MLAVKERLAQRGSTCTDQRDDVCPVIDLTGRTWPTCLASLDGHHRNSFKRRLRTFTTAQTMRLERATTEDGRRVAFHDSHEPAPLDPRAAIAVGPPRLEERPW